VAVPVVLRFAEREARVWIKLWPAWSFSFFVMPLLFLGSMGLGLGSYIDGGRAPVGGFDYLTFVAPGLLAGGVMQNTAGDGLWGVMGGHKWQGTFNAAVASPLRPADVYGGWLLWRGVLGGITAVSFVLAASLLGGVPSAWGVLAVPAAVLCALAFSALISAYSITRETDASFPVVIRLVIMPMFVFSGTFFPLEEVPTAVRPLAWATPLWHAVELCRGATTGTLGLLEGLGHTAFLAACIAVGCAFGVRGFNRRLAA
jgi:lipooligosaccharide transport system permease protein